MKMKVLSVEFSRDIVIKPIETLWYQVQGAFHLDYKTDVGDIRVNVDDGFMFDGRSGGPMVDALGIAPNLGSQPELKCWLAHDINAYDICFSYDETNDILYNMLRDIGYGWFRAKMIYTAVNCSESWFGEPLPNDREFPNLAKIHVRHYDRLK